jgi:CheY-like chemotaxis protein
MDGNIYFESEENVGSKFYFELELTTVKEDKVKNTNLSDSNMKVSQLKGNDILLVEDNEINQQIIIGLLEESGINIDIANNGKEAIEKVKEKSYALILMDIQMPILDGYEATKQIRKMGIDLPIIALSANAMQQNKVESLAVGMNDHLTKPINIEVLFETLLKYIPIKTTAINKNSENKEINKESLHHVNTNIGMNFMSNNKELYYKVINSFIEKYSDISIDSLDTKELEIFMHSIKSTSANIGAIELSKIAQKLETTQDNSLFKEFFEQLQLVLLELKTIQHNDTKDTSKPMIKGKDRDLLFQSLYDALQTNRPKKCADIIEELNKYTLLKEDYEIFVEIKKSIEKYNFKDAVVTIEKIVKN